MEIESGTIEVIYGPMFSGKSTELLRNVRRFGHAKKKCLVVNYAHDLRYSDQDVMSTHDQQMWKAMRCIKLKDIESHFAQYDAIAIDEGQFFPDIVEMSERLANSGKHVIVSGLDGTFERKPFGNILNLVAIAEKVTKLNSICAYCFKLASFSHRTVKSNVVELIGGEETYKPVCRKCYFVHHPPATTISVSNTNTNVDSPISNNSPKESSDSSSVEEKA